MDGAKADGLTAFDPPIGLHPALSSGAETTLQLRDKLLTRHENTYYVRSAHNTTVLKINGEYGRNGSRSAKVFLDAFGRALFTMKRRSWSLNQIYEAYDCHGQKIFSAKSIFSFTKTLKTASFQNEYDDRQMSMRIEGRWKDRRAEMRCEQRLVANIDMRDPGRYTLHVAPGVDLALVTALAVAFVENGQSENTSAWTS